MSRSEIERFVRDLPTNAALGAEIAKDERLESVVAVAARHGYRFTVEQAADFTRTMAKAASGELSDAALDRASGGNAGGILSSDPYTPPPPWVIAPKLQ
jgi:predicted ribosomally synthesized peptide with nif11-like leader